MNTQVLSGKVLSPFFKYSAIALAGGVVYYGIEILYRGHSHWSMAICGGVCLVAICLINQRFPSWNLLLRAALCALAITAIELFSGCVLNLWLDWHVWDYRSQPFNLLGQIAPLFTFFWFLLSLPVCFIYNLQKR